MNEQIINKISNELSIKPVQVQKVITLLSEDNTVPFIARYRKEVTGYLNEDEIRFIQKEFAYQEKLAKRKEEVIKLIAEKELLTKELEYQINQATILQEVEDLYAPFKDKRKTKATEAIKNGLTPLASYIYNEANSYEEVEIKANEFLNDQVKTIEEAISGAGYIIAEKISDDVKLKQLIRKHYLTKSIIKTKAKKNYQELDPKQKYHMYYDNNILVKKIKPHNVLAINRAEKQKVITVSVSVEKDEILELIKSYIKIDSNKPKELLEKFIEDSYKRLIEPSMTRYVRTSLTEIADERAIELFGQNLESLIMQAPIKGEIILGIDPAYRTGCKLAVINENADVLEISIMYPTPPKEDFEGSKKVLAELLQKHKVTQIVIGNGTASRETERFVRSFIKDNNLNQSVAIVSEAGASVYSASDLAKEEFPNLSVEQRSAISIARRVLDPMAELVKIEPKSIGVGQYQHDVNQKVLQDSLEYVMVKSINRVGVDLNTASPQLLRYVSGLDKTIAKNIVKYRSEKGSFNSREQLKEVSRLGDKAYEQCAGFLKIQNGIQPLDQTFIHPESYKLAQEFIDNFNIDIKELGSDVLRKKLENINLEEVAKKLNTSEGSIKEIIEALVKAGIDVREELLGSTFNPEVTELSQVKEGMKIKGEVRNIVDFGAFVDIGIKEDALIHISKLSTKFINDVTQVLNIGDVLDFTVVEVNYDNGRVQLSLI